MLPNSYYSVVLNLPHNAWGIQGKYLLGGASNDNKINTNQLKQSISEVKTELKNIISSQAEIYKRIKKYYKDNLQKNFNNMSFEDFLKTYSSLGSMEKVTNLSNKKQKSTSKKQITSDDLSAIFDKYQKENWEDVDKALSLFLDARFTNKKSLEAHINKTLAKYENDVKIRISNIINFLDSLDATTQQQLKAYWHGQEKTIFDGKQKDSFKIIDDNMLEIKKSLDNAKRKASKNNIFARRELSKAKQQIKNIIDTEWQSDLEYSNLPVENQNQIKQRMIDYAIYTFLQGNPETSGKTYNNITQQTIEAPIVIKKGKAKKLARSSVQELMPQFSLSQKIDINTLLKHIQFSRSGDISTRSIPVMVTATWDDNTLEQNQSLINELFAEYKANTNDINATFENFAKEIKKIQIKTQEVQDKIDDYILLRKDETSDFDFAIAFSDKLYHPFEDNKHLKNIGLENGSLFTNLNGFLNNSIGEELNEMMIFTLLNTSTASLYSHRTKDITPYISKILNAYILNLTMNPTNFAKQLLNQHNFSGEILYLYKIGGFNIPVFEALSQIYQNLSNFETNKQLIQFSITPDSSNAYQLYASAKLQASADKQAQWEYVATQVANNTALHIVANLHQITDMFMV